MNVGELKAALEEYDDDVEVAILFANSRRAKIASIYSMRDFEDEGIDPMELETRKYPTINVSFDN